MLGRAYTGAFNASREYYGYFDPRTYYLYNDPTGTDNDYFYPNNSSGTWNGNWLNWATMHRADVARKVMGGGYYNTLNNCYEVVTQDTGNRVANFSFNAAFYTDLNNVTKRMTPHTSSITISHPNSQMYMTIGGSNYRMRARDSQKEGVLHAFKDKARMSLFVYDTSSSSPANHHGGKILRYMSENATELNSLINDLNTINPETWTPLAETLFTVYGYIRQDNSTGGTIGTSNTGPRYRGTSSYLTGTTQDPFYFPSLGSNVWCTKQNVILITDGESTQDTNIPSTYSGQTIAGRINPKPNTYTLSSDGSAYLIDVAHWGQTTDMRSDLPGNQTADFYAVFAFGSGSNLLRDAARYGKFKQSGSDSNGNNMPDLASEYDSNGDGMPDNYFEAESGQELEAAIFQAFQLATASIASGTAAAVTSQTRSGEGAAYQALFFPPSSTQIAPAWSGQVHAFLLDARGNMREDTNGNGRLDLKNDRVVRFEGNQVFVSADTDGNADINATETNATPLGAIDDLNFLWSTTPWLNAISDSNVVTNRSLSGSNYLLENKRYIFTFADVNNNGNVDSSEVFPFTHVTADCNNAANFCSYLTLYGNNTGSVSPSASLSVAQLSALSQRQINFVRGVDVGNATIGTVNDVTRSRTIDGSPTWRLGDIIYSSPTVVGKPAENYHLIYQDKTYEAFFKKYQNRRQVIYTGGNDGMLHAFNGGFYNSTTIDQYTRGAFQLSWTNSEVAFPMGAELWAYVPYNLLPHLKWLMHKDYGENLHAAYVDLKPRIFDARVFFLPDGITPSSNSTHPNGWGTILVAGMRLGGAQIDIDINKDGTADRSATSAYIVMDITDPEQPPTLLGEIRMPGQGFTTSYPTVMPMTARNANTAAANQWYLVFGSGPAKLVGSHGVANSTVLGVETSNQNGRLFVVDLKALVAEGVLKTINSSGTLVAGGSVFATTEAASYISDPVAVDLNIGPYATAGEFKTDVVYYGTVAGSQTNGLGTLRRFRTNNSQTPSDWVGINNQTLINVGKPITSAPSVAIDDLKRLWIYFGTGRFYNRGDILQESRMTFYGVKEPVDVNGTKTWATVTSGLFNSTDVTIVDNGTCGGVYKDYKEDCVRVFKGGSLLAGAQAAGSWKNLTDTVTSATGWRLDFSPAYERVLGQAAILGGTVLFTSYTPSNDVCSFEGSSKLWALYYKTGTAYYRPIIGATGTTFNTSIDLGPGMALTPNIHVGEKGATAYVQSSTGAIETIEFATPYDARSGTVFWRKNTD
jgi:type IV pilus assembly protein PilY1